MMKITQYAVNAFITDQPFSGNPAAICILENNFLPDETMQNIAFQNNLPETVFIVPVASGIYQIRWFAPANEISLCGYATLAAAYIIFNFLETTIQSVSLNSIGGLLSAKRHGELIELNFSAVAGDKIETPELICRATGLTPIEVIAADDYLVILKNQSELVNLKVDINMLAKLDRRGVVFSAPGDKVDFVSRVFHPKLSIEEDSVCGSAHCQLVPYWHNILQKNQLEALQLSKRGGHLLCEIVHQNIYLKGRNYLYLKGEIFI